MTTTEGALMKKTEYILFTCTVPFPCVDKFSRICSFLKQHPLYNVQCCIPDGLNDQDRRLFLRFKKKPQPLKFIQINMQEMSLLV